MAGEAFPGRAYEEVRRFLMRGKLHPGERLVTRTLAAELGVSTTPLREALLRLASENALHIDSRGTVVVPVLTREAYVEIRDLRGHLEGMRRRRRRRMPPRWRCGSWRRCMRRMRKPSGWGISLARWPATRNSTSG